MKQQENSSSKSLRELLIELLNIYALTINPVNSEKENISVDKMYRNLSIFLVSNNEEVDKLNTDIYNNLGIGYN